MRIREAFRSARLWLQRKRDRKHHSRWDVQGRDVLREMIQHDKMRKARKLP